MKESKTLIEYKYNHGVYSLTDLLNMVKVKIIN